MSARRGAAPKPRRARRTFPETAPARPQFTEMAPQDGALPETAPARPQSLRTSPPSGKFAIVHTVTKLTL